MDTLIVGWAGFCGSANMAVALANPLASSTATSFLPAEILGQVLNAPAGVYAQAQSGPGVAVGKGDDVPARGREAGTRRHQRPRSGA